MRRFAAIAAILLAFPSSTHAAELFFGAAAPEVALGESFAVGVFLDAQGKEINATEGAVTFDGGALRLEAIRDGESVIPYWIERPSLSGCPDDCRVRFAGAIPGGISHPRAPLFSLVFTALVPGKTSVSADGFRALIDDGKGTDAGADISPIAFSVRSDRTAVALTEAADDVPPEPFDVTLVRDRQLYDGRVSAVFSTTDKGTGIDRYEAAERLGPQGPLLGLRWRVVESPYLLLDQSLRSSVYVKAVDRAGNARVSVLAAPALPSGIFLLAAILGILFLAITLLFVAWRFVWRTHPNPARHGH
ncbi:hypothetical protein A2856_04370 [Candidatus Uhrbacteria bacterium RIFCSPHIGHO2_01_FULL_63_20]|uniref:Cohesin domain-containing protein n=1 Tax=Candidatus Uhrbacteria bacterium RIFCSPHIGHO2_01_FULL_63_20 TaxID=1802385 RepID=A0A1F7TNR7_9BACT|nr:MAG: hypothetical protein A2856_04370 [Candidatus Uhrbacteria bacterium RIFCSPHIGHO2_01_FULL_63_20]